MNNFPILYRYQDHQHWGTFEIELIMIQPVKETPQGWWITKNARWNEKDWRKQHRWISKTARIRWAYDTKELAWDSFVARKQGRVMHLKHDLEIAEALLDMANKKEMVRKRIQPCEELFI